MRIITRSTVLGTALVALAILNFSVLDQVGVGLVDSVNAKFEELGAEWIGLQVVNHEVDAAELAAHLGTIPGVRSTVVYWSALVFDFSSSAPRPSGSVAVVSTTSVQWVMTSDTYDLEREPFVFVFREETSTQAKFYRDFITWVEGRPPGAGEVAVSTQSASETGVGVGDTITQTFGANPFNQTGLYTGEYRVSGIYQRAYTDPAANVPEIVLVGEDPALRAALHGGPVHTQSIVIVQASLPVILDVSSTIVQRTESLGYYVSTGEFHAGARSGGPVRSTSLSGGAFSVTSEGGFIPMEPVQPIDIIMYANGAVLGAALDAADRAGRWFRMLTAGAVVLACLGIAFVTAAMERKVRRDVGVRQAVGFRKGRIYLHWARVALVMGLAGAAVGIGLVFLLSTLGLSPWLLGLDLAFRSSVGLLAAPIAAVIVYALATLPTYHRVLRAAPAENLRVLRE